MNLSSVLEDRENLFPMLKIFSDCHRIEGGRIYLVGGAVRDLIMGKEAIPDLDIIITSGHPFEYAECLKTKIIADKIAKDHKYDTVKLSAIFKGVEFSIDINHARIENYDNPGSLPDTEWVDSLFYDVQRRDFSVNSMAMSINEDSFGEVLDYKCGISDLKNRTMRILHEDSFIDDPSRMIRLVRYKQRLGFDVEACTESLFKRAVSENYLEHISLDRIFKELVKCLLEHCSHLCFQAFNSLGLFSGVHFKTDDLELFEKSTQNREMELCPSVDRILLKILLLASPLFLRFNMPGTYRKSLENHIENSASWKKAILSSDSDSELYRISSAIPLESLISIAFSTPSGDDLRMRIKRYMYSLRGFKTHLTGKDLVSMGVEPGKRIRLLLDELLECRIDGIVSDSRKAEIEFIEDKLGRNV